MFSSILFLSFLLCSCFVHGSERGIERLKEAEGYSLACSDATPWPSLTTPSYRTMVVLPDEVHARTIETMHIVKIRSHGVAFVGYGDGHLLLIGFPESTEQNVCPPLSQQVVQTFSTPTPIGHLEAYVEHDSCINPVAILLLALRSKYEHAEGNVVRIPIQSDGSIADKAMVRPDLLTLLTEISCHNDRPQVIECMIS